MHQRRKMLLLAVSVILVTIAAWSQGLATVSWRDSQGNPAGVYLEGSRAYLRVFNPSANIDPNTAETVEVQVSSQLTGDIETLVLTETGASTSIFTGSIQLDLSGAAVNGRLGTGQASTAWDILTVTYGDLTETASTIGSYTSFIDDLGDSISTLRLGDPVRVRVQSPMADIGPGPDTLTVSFATTESNGDVEGLALTETGETTGVFEGSIPSAGLGAYMPATQNDGVLQAHIGVQVFVQYLDVNGVTGSSAMAVSSLDLPETLQLVTDSNEAWDPTYQPHPLEVGYQGHGSMIRVTSGVAAGHGPIEAQVTSLLGGAEKTVQLYETQTAGLFYGSVYFMPRAPWDPPLNSWGLDVTEYPGPPHVDDTVRAVLLLCQNPPCPQDEAPVVGSTLRFVDAQGNAINRLDVGADASVDLIDWNWRQMSVEFQAQPSGDVESVFLGWPSGQPPYRVTLPTESGPALPGDGRLQLTEGGTLTASHQNVLGFSSSTASVPTGGSDLEILDRQGNPVDYVLVRGQVRLRAHAGAANTNPTAPDTLQATVRAVDSSNGTRDTEDLQLVETGASTGIFTGQVLVEMTPAATPNDGRLQAWSIGYSVNDTVEATVGTTTRNNVPIISSIIRLIDASGADVTSIEAGSPARIQVESDEYNQQPAVSDITTVSVETLTGGDWQWITLHETGAGTAIFEGSVPTAPSFQVVQYNGLLEVRAGETVQAKHWTYFGQPTDQALVEAGADGPPTALDDSAVVAEDGSVVIPVLANDSDAEGPLTVQSIVTYPTAGDVSLPGDGTVVYTPYGDVNGTDTFTYRVADSAGQTADATVSVTVTPVNDPPHVAGSIFEVSEDYTQYVSLSVWDPEGQPLTLQSWIPPSDGVLEPYPPGQHFAYFYTPAPNANGDRPFTYTFVDNGGLSATATSIIRILPVNDPPVVVNDAATTAEDTSVLISVAQNDSEVDGEALILQSVTQPAHGTASVFTANRVSYTPAANYNGPDTFTYRIADVSGFTAVGTVNMTVTPVNDPPVAVADSATTPEDAAIALSVLANDSDPDSNPLSVTAVTQPAHGAATFTASSVTYTPTANYNGADSLTYTISDGNGGTATATVSVTVSAVNDAPTAGNDSASTSEDTAVTVNVLTNDSDLDGDSLSVTAVTQPAHGSASFTASSVTYTPAANYNGADSFTYTISDGHGGSATATVSANVSAVNDAPTAGNDSASTSEDTAATVNVLTNDSDLDGDTLSVTAVTQPAHGAASFTASSVTYTPAANYNGADSFTYTIGDGNGGTATATVSVNVSAVNDVPTAVNDSASTNEDTAVTSNVLANDSDPDGDSLTVTAVTQPAHGAATRTSSSVTYTPAANYNGADSFTYTISDGNGGNATATVSVNVTAVNDAPTAVNDSASTNEDTAVTANVLTNDSDLDGDSLTVTAVTQPAHGAATRTSSSVTYTPAANYNGADSFIYTISDGNGGNATATVSVNVSAVNDAPVAVNDSVSTAEDTAGVFTVLANDTDVEGNSLSITAVTQPAHGSATKTSSTVTYTPAANYNGADSFTYSISDGNGGSATATVSVNVSAVNDPPTAVNDTGITREGVGVIVSVLANDSDIEGPLTVTGASTAAGGTTSFNSSSVTFTPTANFNGISTFTYTISDGSATNTATVTITVKDALERVAVLATNSAYIQLGADVLSGDVIVNQAGAGPFLNGGVELYIAGTITTPSGWDVEGDSITIASGTTVASDVFYNSLSNSGSITGQQTASLTLPVFSTLPVFLAATPGTADVSVGINGSTTLAPGSYRDLIVGKKGTVTFSGGTYHFRSISTDTQAKLFFSAASTVRVQQRLGVKATSTVGPSSGATVTAAEIIFYVAGINGTSGGINQTPRAVEIATDGNLSANLYAPNGTIWFGDSTQARGSFIAKDVHAGPNVQITLQSAWSGQ